MVAPLDSDGDGIPDDFPPQRPDRCPDSILDETVIIGDCDSGVENVLLRGGCTISDRVEICAERAKNHGKFVRCVSKLTNRLKRRGILSGREKGHIQRCASQSDLP